MRALAIVVLLGGCLGEATVPGDLSGTVEDLRPPPVDLGGDAIDGGYGCVQLNACEKQCTTQDCVKTCRDMATAAAVTAEAALQACFNQWCPESSDGGSAVCMPDGNGMFSAACQTCIANTQATVTMSCAGGPPECHQCVSQAQACRSN